MLTPKNQGKRETTDKKIIFKFCHKIKNAGRKSGVVTLILFALSDNFFAALIFCQPVVRLEHANGNIIC
jgi:hypothetical protein